MHVAENGGRRDGRQGVDGLWVFTITNAWKIVRCECMLRRRLRNVRPFFGVSSTESVGGRRSAGRMKGVRSVLKVSELNKSMKEWAYHKSLHGKCGMLRG